MKEWEHKEVDYFQILPMEIWKLILNGFVLTKFKKFVLEKYKEEDAKFMLVSKYAKLIVSKCVDHILIKSGIQLVHAINYFPNCVEMLFRNYDKKIEEYLCYLSGFDNLQRLILDDCMISDVRCEYFSTLKNLNNLSFFDCNLITDNVISYLSAFNNLNIES